MFTVCPKCALTLVVTAADLRIAQGYVRCGRCLNVFNALARLSEERPTSPASEGAAIEPREREAPPRSAAPSPPSPQSAPCAASPQPAPSAASAACDPGSTADATGEIEFELDSSVIVTSARGPAALQEPGDAQAQGVPAGAQEEVQEQVPAARAPGAAEFTPAATATAASADASARPTSVTSGADAQPPEMRSTEQQRSESASHADPNADASQARQTNTVQPQPDVFGLEARRPRAGPAWMLGAAALAIALALQIVNHYRDALAAAGPMLRGPLSTIYSALGVKLAPRWKIHAYDVRQLGASVAGAPAGEIVVRASVKNTAGSAQPLPLLRVTLQDRFGNRIAARDVPPPYYLPSSVAPGTLLAAGSRVDATMVFVDPGPQAVGFEIDACLRRQNGEVECAHGP